MTAGRWERVAALFDAAVELPPPERVRYLDLECAGDAELRAEVESMLAHDSADSRLSGAVQDAVAAFDLETRAASQARFGAWRVTGRVGSGGMGTVFKATRADGTFEKEAAIKVLHIEAPDTMERFRRERQILARLEHPNIARLIDGGETDAGAPFLVMEFVDGEPLLDYAARHALSRPARLRLFLRVCSAVQYLHQNLVVHRDLKPSNILVTADGTPKLLDFGIAKVLHEDAQRTATGSFALTPQYASPEQVRGLPVTIASDIYSLGVILFELLAWRPPYEFKTLAPVEIDRVVCELPVARPGIDPDLDNILLMALRKEPERRYATVDQFARDIEHSMSNLPVAARPDTFGYRASKFARRNWVAIAGLAIVLGSLTTGIVVTRREAARAQKRFLQARLFANGLLEDFYPRIQNLTGATEARGVLVKSTLAYLNQLAAEASGDPELQFDLAVSFNKIGDLQGSSDVGNTGEHEAALKTYREAIRLAEAAMAGGVDRKRALDTLANAGIGVGEAAMNLGQWEVAIEALRKAKKAGEETGSYRHITSAYDREGDIYLDRGELERALGVFRESEKILDDYRATPGNRISTWQRTAQALWDLGRMDEARAVMSKTAAVAEEFRKARPSSLYRNHVLINSRGQTAGLLGGREPSLRQPDAALPHARAALELCLELIAKDPADINSRTHLIEIAGWVAPVFRVVDHASLEKLLGELDAIGESALSSGQLAALEASRADCLAGLGRHREALTHFERAADLARQSVKSSPERTAPALLLCRTLLDAAGSRRALGENVAQELLAEVDALSREWSQRVPNHSRFQAIRRGLRR